MSIVSDDSLAVEEERRLCYVGITRAMKHLTLTYAKSRMVHGSTQYNKVSRFVREIPGRYLKMQGVLEKEKPAEKFVNFVSSARPYEAVSGAMQSTYGHTGITGGGRTEYRMGTGGSSQPVYRKEAIGGGQPAYHKGAIGGGQPAYHMEDNGGQSAYPTKTTAAAVRHIVTMEMPDIGGQVLSGKIKELPAVRKTGKQLVILAAAGPPAVQAG